MPVKRMQPTSSEMNSEQDVNFQVNFHVQVMDYEWQRQNEPEGMKYGADADVACDDIAFAKTMVCWVKSNGLSYQQQNYNLNEGCTFNYDVTQLSSQRVPFVDTIKLACFTQRPNMNIENNQANAGSVMNNSRNDFDTFALLCAKHISMDDLLLHGTRKNGYYVDMRHNFSHNKLRVRIKNASVCFAGTSYTDATQYENALKAANVESFSQLCNSPMMVKSMLHCMPLRNSQIAQNANAVGQSIARCCKVRPHSIGSMMENAYTCGMIEGEMKKLSDMGRFFQTDKGSLAPEWAAHNLAHACAVTGTQPHVPWADTKRKPNSNPGLLGIYEPVRELTGEQVVILLHTCLELPFFSNDITPYVSDAVCMPTLEHIVGMQTGGGTWPEAAFEMTECIDNAMSVPNDFSSRANDCEGGTALHTMSFRNIGGLFSTARSLLQDLSTPERRDKLANWVCNTCNTVLPRSQHYAFAVQALLIGSVAQYAADCNTLTVGAKSASFTTSEEMKLNAQEGGHSCAALAVNKVHVEELRQKTYSTYTLTDSKVKDRDFHILSKPMNTPVRMEHEYKESTSYELCAQTCDSLDIMENKTPYILESTAPIGPHYMTGVITAQISGPTLSDSKKMKVPFSTYFQQMELSLLRNYVTDMANVRVQGFNTKDPDPKVQPPFYNTIYMSNNQLVNQVESDGQYYLGVSANSFLYHKDAHMTTEQDPMPLMSQEEIHKFDTDMEKQWEETRLPTVGRHCINKMMAKWHAAPATPIHCPENLDEQLYRCNVTLSGKDGREFIRNHQKEIACQNSSLIATEKGLFADVHVYYMAENTVVVSQALRMNKFRDKAQNL